MKLGKYSLGCGDRFAQEASAQLAAFRRISDEGIRVVPVWNKSNREHEIIGTEPESVREAAQQAVLEDGWEYEWHVDADHINMDTVEPYIATADFFTIDVADSIGSSVNSESVDKFLIKRASLIGRAISIDGLETPLLISSESAKNIAQKYLPAIQTAGKIYRKITDQKDPEAIIPEVSMDETDIPQKPEELLLILAAIADENIPVQTIAPRFSGRFNKGVEYVGDPKSFAEEFEADILVVAYAVKNFGLPENLKLSVHSGSDKFAIYPEMNRLIGKHAAGLHLKTAGTTWLEEIIGLAEAGGSGLEIAKAVYVNAFAQKEALCKPYAEVINIDYLRLPSPGNVEAWDSDTYVRTLRHNSGDDLYNADFRQLIHVGYKVAATMGQSYLDALAEHREIVARNVRDNLYERHLKPVYGNLK